MQYIFQRHVCEIFYLCITCLIVGVVIGVIIAPIFNKLQGGLDCIDDEDVTGLFDEDDFLM